MSTLAPASGSPASSKTWPEINALCGSTRSALATTCPSASSILVDRARRASIVQTSSPGNPLVSPSACNVRRESISNWPRPLYSPCGCRKGFAGEAELHAAQWPPFGADDLAANDRRTFLFCRIASRSPLRRADNLRLPPYHSARDCCKRMAPTSTLISIMREPPIWKRRAGLTRVRCDGLMVSECIVRGRVATTTYLRTRLPGVRVNAVSCEEWTCPTRTPFRGDSSGA